MASTRYWCDGSGLYVRGFAHVGPRAIQRVTLLNGDAGGRASGPRPATTLPLFLGGTVPPNCGFALYVEGRPTADLRLELDTAEGTLSTQVELPDHPLPVLEDPTGSFEPLLDRLLAEAGPGPVLALGWRVAAGTNLEKLKARFGGRRVFNVDIHPGLNVDVLGDVHRLFGLLPGQGLFRRRQRLAARACRRAVVGGRGTEPGPR